MSTRSGTDRPVESAPDALAGRLEELARELSGAPGSPAGEPIALLPADPVSGTNVVACWNVDGDFVYAVVRLQDGAPVTEPAAVRETFALLAMAESLEAAVDADAIGELRGALTSWRASATHHTAAAAATTGANSALWDAVDKQLAAALLRLDSLQAETADGQLGVASPLRLDRLGGQLRELQREWEQLSRACELWAAAVHSQAPELVGELWPVLASAHRGPLRTPPAVLVQAGREAGLALAAEVLAAPTGRQT